MRDLRGSNAPGRIDSGRSGKLIGAVIIIALLGAAGAYAYHAGMLTPAPKLAQPVPDSDLPS